MDRIFKDYDMDDYKFVGHISDSDLYGLFDDDTIEGLFGGYDYARLVEIILRHGDKLDTYNDLNSQSCDDVLEAGNYVIGEFQNVMGGTDWTLWIKRQDEECCPFCGSKNFEWMGDAFGEGEMQYHCHECDRFFDERLI